MIGKRIEWGERGPWNPGDYAFGPDGAWHGITPSGIGCNLALHKVTEHEDGTITVEPSILVTSPHGSGGFTQDEVNVAFSGTKEWHGFLERGVWREC